MTEMLRYTADEMEERLEEFLDPVLSSRRSAAGPAAALAKLTREQQEFVLHWVKVSAKTSAELAFQFAACAPQALACMDPDSVEAWIVQGMDAFDRKGLLPAIAVIQTVESFAEERAQRLVGLPLEDISGVLVGFVHGLNGRRLRLDTAPVAYTDTETLFLPTMLNRFSSKDENFRLYKAMAVHLWAQTWYGTWLGQGSGMDCGRLQDATARFSNPDKALGLFHALETVRLDAHIARELPGLYRDMGALRQALDRAAIPAGWYAATAALKQPGSTVQTSYALLARLYEVEAPEPCCYQGALYPDRVEPVMKARLEEDKDFFRIALAKLSQKLANRTQEAADSELESLRADARRFQIRRVADPDMPQGFTFELLLDGKPLTPPDDVQGTMASIIQDLGEIPADYLVAAGPGAYPSGKVVETDPSDVWKGTYHEEGASFYDEWDYLRQHYRKHWCVLRELDVHPKRDDFVDRTLRKHGGLVKSLRRTFEALRGEDKLLKKQPDGEDIDIDALVEAYADTQSGLEMSERLFTRMHKEERNIAVMFMVDMSGSTKGWINDAERESLILLCESLETLGDRYAIYGFSGNTRKRCELYRIKRFDESYNDDVRARISGIEPKDYTRMGVAIRHLCTLLNGLDARTKLLVTLSDGKPEDYDGYYRGEYGIEDTRQALFEARRNAIHPFCITIDEEAREYLPHMYGAANYIVIDEVRKLPLKVSDIYRRLTS